MDAFYSVFMQKDNPWKIPCGQLSLRSTSYFCYLATPTLSKAAYTTQIVLRYVLISIVHACVCVCTSVIIAWGAEVSALCVRGWGVHSCQSGEVKGTPCEPGAVSPVHQRRERGFTWAQQACQSTRTAQLSNWKWQASVLMAQQLSEVSDTHTQLRTGPVPRVRNVNGREAGERGGGSPGWYYLWLGGVRRSFLSQTEKSEGRISPPFNMLWLLYSSAFKQIRKKP